MHPVKVTSGSNPIVLGLPHTGTHIPNSIWDQLTPQGQTLSDTDWHVHQLYDGLIDTASTVRATFHRYVIDANRDPSGVSLYPGQNTTGLVPLTDFDGNALWNKNPTNDEIEQRRKDYHAIYHQALKTELDRVHALHGYVILYDCHSIRSHIPYLFDGTLPDLNIGTNNGTTCDTIIENAIYEICQNSKPYSSVLNNRFKGGWTTRYYGQPDKGYHAIQMELAQNTYLKSETAPWDYCEQNAGKLRPVLHNILNTLAKLKPNMEKLNDKHSS